MCKQYDAKVILKDTGTIGHGIETYCKANERYYKLIDYNIDYTNRLRLKITEKKHYIFCTGFPKCIGIQ